eukprot:379034-Prorocentrum_minimum.AAC.1
MSWLRVRTTSGGCVKSVAAQPATAADRKLSAEGGARAAMGNSWSRACAQVQSQYSHSAVTVQSQYSHIRRGS